jgi:transposase
MRQEVLTGAERRRRWTDPEKRSILGEVGLRGATVAEVARRHDLTRQHLYQWRAELRKRGESLSSDLGFLPVEISAASATPAAIPAPIPSMVEIVLANGRLLRGIEGLSAAGLAQLIRVLESA